MLNWANCKTCKMLVFKTNDQCGVDMEHRSIVTFCISRGFSTEASTEATSWKGREEGES